MEVKPGYKQTEVGVIPEDWQAKPLVGLAVIQHGFGFQSQYFKAFGRHRLTTPGHFHETGGFRDIGDKQKFYDGPLPDGYLLSQGDLIVAMTEQADGLLSSAALVPVGDSYLHNQRLGKVKTISPNLSVEFLYRVFNSKAYRAKVKETAAGTKVKHTSPSKLLEIPIPLPPTKAEQEAIAEALSDADALIESLEQLLVKKRHLKQGAMQELLTGKQRLPGFNGKWEVRRLGDVAEIVMGQSPSSAHYNNNGDGLPLIQGNADISARKTIRRVFTTEITKRGRCGDILMSVRAPVGEVSRAVFDVCLGRGVCAIRYPNDFLYQALIAKEPSWAKLSKGSTFDSVNSTDVKAFGIDLPEDEAEQVAIVAILSDMDDEIAALEAKLAKSRQLKQGMMQELLTGRVRLIN